MKIRSKLFTAPNTSLLGKEEIDMTWKEITKKLNSTESVVSLVLGIVVVITAGVLIVNFVRSQISTSTKTVVEQMTQINTPGIPVGEKLNENTPTGFPAKHKVKPGEDLWNIALTYYKSGYNWVTLAKANNLANPDMLNIDQELTIPKADPIYPEGSINGDGASVEAITANKYKVLKDDTLWSISCRAYGDCYKWAEIAQANKLANADIIEVGQELSLPR